MGSEPRLLAAEQTLVSVDYAMFGLNDPTCDDAENFGPAIRAASAETVGWAPNAVMVRVACDLARIGVRVELFDAVPPEGDEPAPDLLRSGELALPGGLLSVPHSVDEEPRLGLELASGPGTYRVRIAGYGRLRATEIWERAAVRGPDAVPAVVEELRGVEHYRIRLWQVSTEPRWPDEDEDD